MNRIRILARYLTLGFATLLVLFTAQAQQAKTQLQAEIESPLDGRDGRELLLRNFRPQPRLRVSQTKIESAKYSVVDVHTHLSYRLKDDPEELDAYVDLMDRNNIAVCCSLDGRLGKGRNA